LGFLNGVLLFGLLGSLVPLVIHLLERRKLPRMKFPSLRFLSELNRRQMRRLNLQRLLILILRMLLVALIAFALARPTLTGPLAALFPEDSPRALALLIDNSASMLLESETGTLAELARRRSKEILAELDPERDEVLLYALEASPRRLGGGPMPPAAALRLLDEWEQAQGGAAIAPGLREAMAELALLPQPRRELFILSDFAAATLPVDSSAGEIPREMRVAALPLSAEAPPNTGLTDLRLPLRPVLPGRPFDLAVAGRSWGGSETESFPVELELDGEHRGGLQLDPPPGRESWRSVTVSLSGQADVVGTWRKRRDRFAPDDELAFTLPLTPELRVLLAAPTAAPSAKGMRLSLAEHLARALDPYRGRLPGQVDLHVSRLEFGDLLGESLEAVDPHLIVLCGGEGLDAGRGELLADYVARGGGLLICPALGGQADLARHLLPRLGGPRALELNDSRAEYLGELDPEHPLFDGFDEEHRRVLGEQALWRSFRCEVGERDILARFRSGRPALMSWRKERGRVRLLLFEAGPEGGELPYSSMFLPLLQELAQETAGAARPLFAEAGHPLVWPLAELPAGDKALHALDPEGRELPVRVDASVYPHRARLERADRPGIYRLRERRSGELEPRELGLAAVRVPAAEGELAPLPADSIAVRLGLERLEVIRHGEPFAAALEAGRNGKELARSILILALLLMAAELWLAQRSEREG
jgi:hypothetical protein